jgi:biopolymer transport protein ExbD
MQFNRASQTEGRLKELDLTPLVGVVILTMMFFMVALYFQHVRADERAKLPDDSLARPPRVERERELVLNFAYRRSGRGQRRDTVPTVLINDRHVEARDLSPELDRQKRTLQSQSGNGALTEVTVLIRADSDVPVGLVQELVQTCRESGFAKFSLQETSTPK